MTRTGTLRLGQVAGIFIGVVGLPTAIAYACSLAPPPLVLPGLLGWSFNGTPTETSVPRNAAVLGDAGLSLSDGTPVALVPLSSDVVPDLARPDALLPVGETVTSGSFTAVVQDVVDTEAPAAPVVVGGALEVFEDDTRGCGHSSCGTTAQLIVDLESPPDDHTPSGRMSYALFVAASELGLAEAGLDGIYVGGASETVWRHADPSERNDDIWVSVAAIDLAGNVSPRSRPVQLHAGPDGCAIQTTWGAGPQAVLAAGLVLLMRRRRRQRR